MFFLTSEFFLNPKCNYSPDLQQDKTELVYVLQQDPRNYDIRHDSSE